MKANTVVVISGKVCAPTKPVPEHPMMDLGEAESHPGLVYKIEMFDYERDLKDFLSSCVPFEDQMRGLVKLGLAHDIPDGIPKENHPYTVPDYEFEVIWLDDNGNQWVKKEQESQEELWGKALLIADMAQFRINHDGSNQIKQLTQ